MDAFDLGNQPEKVQNLGIFGNSFQNLAVQHFSFVKFAVLMKIDGAAKQQIVGHRSIFSFGSYINLLPADFQLFLKILLENLKKCGVI